MTAQLTETARVVQAFAPVDMETAANNGDWVSMKGFANLLVIFVAAVGTSGDNPVLTMKQATDVSGTAAKALNFTTLQAQVQTALTSSDVPTVITQAAGNTYQSATAGDAAKQRLFTLEFKASDLDSDNGFDCVQFSVPDTGSNAQLGAALYILYGARYAPTVTGVSAIVD